MVPADSPRNVGSLLRRLRLRAGLSQAALAERARLSAAAIASLETGQRRRPHPDTLGRLADALQLGDVERSELLGIDREHAAPAVNLSAGGQPRAARQLPEPPTRLIGRDVEIRELRQLLLGKPPERLVTLLGPGGVGKTRVALATAQSLSETFSDGTVFIDLAPVRDERLVAATVAWALGLCEDSGLSASDLLIAHLRQRHMLLVLDNFEQVRAAATFVSQLLVACPNLQVIVTSRAALQVRAEIRFPVEPLSVPEPGAQLDLDALASTPAVRLFVERARAVEPRFALSVANAEAVAAICRRLEGLPLGLELAAARLALLNPKTLLDRLERRLVLTSGATDLPVRQRTLRTTLDWSHALLSLPEQVVFRRLAVFAGGWTLDAAEAVCPVPSVRVDAAGTVRATEVLDCLEGLVRHSLVQTVETAAAELRFGMLETVHEYAIDLLDAAPERDHVRGQHRDWFLHLAQTAQPQLTGPDQSVWLDRLQADAGNLRAALSWCLASGQGTAALYLCAALWRFWWVRHVSEGRRLLASALAAGTTAPPDARATALFGAGMLAWSQADLPAAKSLYEQSLAFRRSLAAPGEVAETLNALAIVLHLEHKPDQAQAAYEESLELSQRQGDDWGTANALAGLAVLARDRGELHQAAALHNRSLELRRARGDKHATAKALHDLALVKSRLNAGDAARAAWVESLGLYREIGSYTGVADCLEGLSWLAARSDATDLAMTWLTAANLVRESVGAGPSPSNYAAQLQNVTEIRDRVGETQLMAAMTRARERPFDEALSEACDLARDAIMITR